MRTSTKIRIRSYVVGFGDCILVSAPVGGRTRHMLIDFGKAPGGSTKSFPDIAADIAKECDNHLDVLVMTHEHLDHMEGFLSQRAVFDAMTIGQVWMSLPSDPKYYEDYPKATLQKKVRAIAAELDKALHRHDVAPTFASMLANNLSNPERIQYLRDLAKGGTKLRYLARGVTAPTEPFGRGAIRFLAPEKDVSVYYPAKRVARAERDARHALSRLGASSKVPSSPNDGDWFSFPKTPRIARPSNLTASDWIVLRERMQSGGVEAVRFIDRAANNTSLCFRLKIDGKSLLFPGDAELESWAMMVKECGAELGRVDFLKVSHHGSHNGTPLHLLDRLLPTKTKSRQQVLVSTKRDVYGRANPVPDAKLLADLATRAKVTSTDGLELGKHVDVWV